MPKKWIHVVITFTLFLFIHRSHSQNSLEHNIEVLANATDAEKIYLQLSGTAFNTSETIWFKAIVTDVLYHIPTTKSGVLHVELIDPLDNRIVDKNLLKISGGISNGFFQLHSSYREGKYIIRAYTEWNKNFGSDFINAIPINIYRLQSSDTKLNPIRDIVFKKDLTANTLSLSSTIAVQELDSLDNGDAKLHIYWKDNKDSLLIKRKKKKTNTLVAHEIPLDVSVITYRLQTKNEVFTKSIVLDDEYGSLQFFPEGGSLVTGLQSVVGFKYLNYKGKGVKIKGWIENSNSTKIADFNSNVLGMGKVVLTPKTEQSYYGVLTTKNGNTFKYELPKAKQKGQVLSLINKGPNRELRIWNKEKNTDSLFVKLFHRGKNLFFLKARFSNGMFSHTIQPEILPHGVIGMTVFDKNYNPIAERHFFNKPNKENLDIILETDKDRYAARDSVQVFLSTKLQEQATQASVSIMAVDSSYFHGTNINQSTILSYFLLQSDVKGTIEKPSYYFKNKENLNELDNLMLTQGWTNYKYKEKKKPRLFRAEKGLEIKGTVINVERLRKKREPRNSMYDLNMLLIGKTNEAYVTETDSTGSFRVMLSDSYGLGRKFMIQPTEASNKSGNLKINIKAYEVPEIAYDIEKIIVPVDDIVEKKVIQKIEEDIKLDPYQFSNTIALNEVVVSDYKITPERAEMVELHGMPDIVIENKELVSKQKKWTENLYKWLLFNYPSKIRVERFGSALGYELAYVYGAEFTYVVIDGIPVNFEDYRLIGDIKVSAVKSVEIIRNTQTANKYYNDVFPCAPICPPPSFPAILAIYTYSGNGLFGALGRIKKNNLINDKAPQYAPIREYYAPEYHDPSNIDWNIPDRRTLLYWKPNVITNLNGQAQVTFFNGDLTGKMLLICEGITANGKVGYTELYYDVDNP